MQAATANAVAASVLSIMGAATGIQATTAAPIIDQRFTEYESAVSPVIAFS